MSKKLEKMIAQIEAEQPTQQPTEQPTEQPIEQPTEQPIEQPTEQPTEKKKDGRGRPRKGEEKNPPKTLDNLLNEYKTAPNENTPQSANNEFINNHVSGALLLVIIDTIFPMAIKYGVKRYNNKDVKLNKLQMDAEEKKSLEPLADAFIKLHLSTLDPTTAFFLSLCFIYGGKAMLEISE